MEITQLHDEIFDFLFQKHLEARARGEEFYFRVDYTFLEDDTQDILVISFWRNNEGYFDVYLLVDAKTTNVFLWGKNNRIVMQKSEDGINNNKIAENKQKEANKEFKKMLTGKGKGDLEELFLPIDIFDTTHGFREADVFSRYAIKYYSNYSSILEKVGAFLEKDKLLIDIYQKEKHIDKWQFSKYVMKYREQQAKRNKKEFIEGLPFCLRNVRIKNYQHNAIQSAEIEDIPTNTRWIFLTGENGIGKTLVLQAIALGLKKVDWLENDFESFKWIIDTQYQIPDKTVCNFFYPEQISSYDISIPTIPVVAYSCNRLNEIKEKASTVSIGHLFDKTPMLNVNEWLLILLKAIDYQENIELKNAEQLIKDKYVFETLLNAFQSILHIKNICLDETKEQIIYIEQDENG